jgi:hypothetical protein
VCSLCFSKVRALIKDSTYQAETIAGAEAGFQSAQDSTIKKESKSVKANQ